MPRNSKRLELDPSISQEDIERYLALKRAVEEKRQREQREALAAKRRELLEECPHPLALAQRFDPTMISTPAMELISQKLVDTLHAVNGRVTISVPPQSGKSTLLRWLLFWGLLENPDRRFVFASYATSLARTSGRIIRTYVETFGQEYGITIDDSHADAADWQCAGFNGGVYSVGVGGALTGRSCDGLMVVDDPLRNMQDADSETVRENTQEWWESVARTRMAPGTPAVGVATRWNEYDLISVFIKEGWEQVNIPAVSDGETPDALNRAPGEYLISTRGTTPEDWEQLRKEMGERSWWAMAMGAPRPPSGGVWKREWLDKHRVTPQEAGQMQQVIISVDPADTGTGDEAGIVVAGVGLADSRVYILDDASDRLSAAAWARKVCLLWLRWGADQVIAERNLGLRDAIPSAWSLLRRQAVAVEAYEDTQVASAALAAAGDHAAADVMALRAIEEHSEAILDAGEAGPRVYYVQPRQSKLVRAESVAALYETGRARMVGTHKQLEHQMVSFVSGAGKSPDRMDALVQASHVLSSRAGRSRVLV